MEIHIPDYAKAVMNRLNAQGFGCFIVGGCLRDILLMDRTPQDWDICTSAKPEQIRDCFADRKTSDVGIRHGTVGILWDGAWVEVTTYRIDGDYRDGRHPDRVVFTEDLWADLARRDFTMNAMAWHPSTGLVDPFRGQEAIAERRISTVGDPKKRFAEDGLRILRALRFASVLGFTIDEKTLEGIEAEKDRLLLLSPERVNGEFSRLIIGDCADEVLCRFSPVLRIVLPEMEETELKKLPANLPIRLSRLFPKGTEAVLRRLRYDRETIRLSAALARLNGLTAPEGKREIKEFLRSEGIETAKLYFAAEGRSSELKKILSSGECWSVSQLSVTGKDLIDNGFSPGPEIGRILDCLLDRVIAGELKNQKEALLSAVRGEE